MAEKCWEDFNLGDKWVLPGITVTEAHVVTFASLTGDWNALHMNEEYAKTTVFGGRIAHGMLIYSLAAGIGMQSGLWGDSIAAYMGSDGLRFPAPVKIGDTITVHMEVTDKRETKNPKTGMTMVLTTVKNQRDETAMTVTSSVLMHRR